MSLPQELINMILYKSEGLEHPTAKIMKEEYFHGDLDDWKIEYDEWNKEYFNDIWFSKPSGKVCCCGFKLTNGDLCHERDGDHIIKCWKCQL